jgi:hypothetical protein
MARLTEMYDILRRAQELVVACRITESPVELGKLARRQDIREIRVDDKVLNGELRRLKSGGYMVRLDGRDSENRRRFTLAHEIAHTLLIAKDGTLAIDCADEQIENLCDLAAAELLIPNVLLRRERLHLDLGCIFFLASKFKCSLEAAAWKLLNMRDWKGALLLWRIEKSTGPSLARIVAMPRTLTIKLPFHKGMTLPEADVNWPSIVGNDRATVVLKTFDQEEYAAQRKQLGKNSVATLIRLSKVSDFPLRSDETQSKQPDLFR